MKRVVLSKAARIDRREITAHTVRRFGLQEARRLRHKFEKKLKLLLDAPLSGHENTELDPPGYTFRYATVSRVFIIVYQPVEDGIRVARLLHSARDIAAELDRNAGDKT